MAYSIWGGRGSGYWYTFWCIHPSEEKETKDNAIFEICGICQLAAKDLRDDIESCLKDVAEKDSFITYAGDYAAKKEKLNELRIYIAEFLRDVEIDYPTPFRRIEMSIRESQRKLRWKLTPKAKKKQIRAEYDKALTECFLACFKEDKL